MFHLEPYYITTGYLQVSFGDAGLFHTKLKIFHFSVKRGQSCHFLQRHLYCASQTKCSFPTRCPLFQPLTLMIPMKSVTCRQTGSQTTHLFSSSSWLSSSTLSRSAASTSERSWSNLASISSAYCDTSSDEHLKRADGFNVRQTLGVSKDPTLSSDHQHLDEDVEKVTVHKPTFVTMLLLVQLFWSYNLFVP